MAVLGPFIESGINPHILYEYDLELKMAKKYRSVIKIEAQSGNFAIKKTDVSHSQAQRMIEVVRFLNENKFPTEAIIQNKFGEYFIPTEKGMVYLTKWVDGKSITLNYPPHLLMTILAMAHMHNLGFNYKPTTKFPHRNELDIRKTWEERIDWVKGYSKKINKKPSKTSFEQTFHTFIPFLLDWSNEAIEKLNQWIIQYDSIEHLRKTIIHGRFHHRNIIVTPNNKISILDLHHTSIDTPIKELAYFIRRYIHNKENRNWAIEWLEAYQSQVPLSVAEKKLLGLYLLFPDRLISLAKNYEGSKHTRKMEDDYLKKLNVRFAQMKEMLWVIDKYKIG